jgi:serine/threonine protein kinase
MRPTGLFRREPAGPPASGSPGVAATTRAGPVGLQGDEDDTLAHDLTGLLARLEASDAETLPSSAAAPAGDGLVGRTVGAYTIVRELGRGGMGSVWLAQRADGRYEGQVAIKFLHGGTWAGTSAERFVREGSILARLAHPHIARLIDAGGTDAEGQRYLVLEYVDGMPIDRYCEAQGLGVVARVRLFLDVLAAVAHAHNHLVLHRDIKPANILVNAAGEVKLLDFGIAKLLTQAPGTAAATHFTHVGGSAFTPVFAAPEQMADGDVSTATDVYALGVLLYLLLAGRHPTITSGGTLLEQAQAVIKVEPGRMSEAASRNTAGVRDAPGLARELRGDLDNIVAKALKKNPAERYANAQHLADDLRRYLSDEPVMARPDAPLYLLNKFARRHKRGLAAGAAVLLALAGGAGLAAMKADEARRHRDQAEGLIEFMLGDLRRKLEPTGRLDTLDALGEKALAYYESQSPGRSDADSLGRRARALHLIGEIAERRGDLGKAHRLFVAATQSTHEMMQRSPRDARRIFDHSQSVYWVGYVARRRGQAAEAEASFLEYLRLAGRLVDLQPANLEWRMEKAYAEVNVGIVFLESFRAPQALQLFSDACDTWAGIAASRPDLTIELAIAQGWLAKAHEAKGALERAIAVQHGKVETLRKLPDFNVNRRVQQVHANGHYEIGRLHLALGQAGAAAGPARHATEQLETLVAMDAANLQWLTHLAFARIGLAEVLQALGRLQEAQGMMQRAEADGRHLASAGAAQQRWHITGRGRVLLLKTMLLPAGGGATAVAELEDYVAAVRLAESSGALDADQARIASAAELALGDAHAVRSRQPLALGLWRSAADRLGRADAGGDLHASTLVAHARLRLGAVNEARRLAARIESSGYRHPAFADLRERLLHASGATAAN